MQIRKDVYKLKGYATAHRMWFHKYPELDFDVKNTQKYIAEELSALGLDKVEILAEGVKGVIYTNGATTTLAFRADMDALPITEKTGVSFASRLPGRMHACGHDGHMAILLGLAKWSMENKDKLKHNIVLIFQPAEETVGGALPMIDKGVLKNPSVDYIFAFHIFPNIDQGRIGLRPGPLMAQTTEFDINIEGKTAHGAMPHKGIDSIVAASHLICGLQSLITRRVDPMQDALITIGRIEGGERRNIIAEHVILEGIIRTFDDDIYKSLKEDIIEMLNGLEMSHGVKTNFKEIVYYPVVYNNRRLVERLSSILTKDILVDTAPLMIAEDFSYYQRQIPGVLMLLGSKNDERGYVHALHSNRFNFDEEVLLIGIQTFIDVVCNI